jgi:DNA mismatch endonuclease (patch repair protein)
MPLSRSQQMARIRGVDTTPEHQLARALRRSGLRPRAQHRTTAGRADLAFPRARVAVFVDGCFWHGCPLHYTAPRSRRSFWAAKLRANVARDRRQTNALESAGWRVIRCWEHDAIDASDRLVARIAAALDGARRSRRLELRVVQVASNRHAAGFERWRLEPLRTAAGRRTILRRRGAVGVRRSGPSATIRREG